MRKYLFLLIPLFWFWACTESPVDIFFYDFSGKTGVFIVNQGNFMYGNSSLSFYEPESKRIVNQVFQARNGVPLGDVAQSMTLWNNTGYIVVNNSGKIYVIDALTAEFKGSITGLSSPRYVQIINADKGYITDLFARKISVFNPSTLQLTGVINVGNSASEFRQHSTEQMIQYKDEVFTNCWSYDNKILIIDTKTDRLADSIDVLKQPNSIVLDRFNKIWVLTDGGFEGSPYGYEKPGLLKINPETREIERSFRFDLGDHPGSLCLNASGDSLFYLNRHVWKMSVLDKQLPGKAFITSSYSGVYGGFYSLAVDHRLSEIYVGDAIDHQQNGIVHRYSTSGQIIDEFRVGISPGSFAFKNE
jgi:DNA-binding beta-propeller fold protein YncE